MKFIKKFNEANYSIKDCFDIVLQCILDTYEGEKMQEEFKEEIEYAIENDMWADFIYGSMNEDD